MKFLSTNPHHSGWRSCQRLKAWLHLGLGITILLLCLPKVAVAQQSTDTPIGAANTEALSGIELIEQMEAEDEANGTIDGRGEPYVVIKYIEMNHQLFLPLATGRPQTANEVQSANNEMPWPAIAPIGHTLTREEQAQIEASHADTEAYVLSLVTQQINAAGVNAKTAIIRKSASVGDINTWKEPNDLAHRNYCGPSAIQVTIDAQLPQSMVPGIEAVKDRINTLTPGGFNPDWGTYDTAMCKYLWDHYVNVIRFGERYLQQPSRGTSQQGLWNQLVRHVDKNYTLPTGAKSGSLKQWVRNVDHITALMGYDAGLENGIYPVAMYQMRYAETSGSVAGYTGTEFKIWYPGTNVWNAISLNNTQCVLKAGI